MRLVRSHVIYLLALLAIVAGLVVAMRSAYAQSSVGKPAHISASVPARLLVIGDSISVGYDALVQKDGYAFLLAHALNAQLGMRAAFGINTPEMYAALERQSLPGATYVVIELGTNDTASDHQAFVRDYPAILAIVRRFSPYARLVCTGPWAPYSALQNIDAYTISQDCVAAHGVYVDLQRLFAVAAYHGPAGFNFWGGVTDTFHPNDRGHLAIALAIQRALRSGPLP